MPLIIFNNTACSSRLIEHPASASQIMAVNDLADRKNDTAGQQWSIYTVSISLHSRQYGSRNISKATLQFHHHLWCSCYPTLIPLWDSKNVGKKSYISSRHLATRFSFCRVMKPGCATSWVESPTQIGGWAVIFHRKSDVYWEYVPKVVGFQGVLPLLSWPFQQQSSFTQQMCELMIHMSHVFQLCSQSHQDQIARRLSPHAVSFQSSSCRLPGELRKTHQ